MRCNRGAQVVPSSPLAKEISPHRISTALLGVAAALFLAVGASAQERMDPFAPADEAALEVEIVSEPDSYHEPWSNGRVVLSVDNSCSETRRRKSDVVLRWELDGVPGDALRVDISMFPNGFQNGIYLTSGVRGPRERDVFFGEADAGIYYQWRLLARRGDAWVVVANERFKGRTCIFDGAGE